MKLEHNIWTVQLARWRLVRELDIPLFDITAKSGIRAFAPAFEDVMSYKRGEMTEDEYTRIYKVRMEQSKVTYPTRWADMLRQPKMALACYCPAGQFCHRHLFAEILSDYLKSFHHEVVLRGEILSTKIKEPTQ